MAVTIVIDKVRTPVTLESRTPPLPAEAALNAFEEKLGYALPGSYRLFLKKYNGGANASGFVGGIDDDPDTPYMSEDMVRDFYSLDAGEDYCRLRLPEFYFDDDWPDHALPIADDAGGNFFVLLLGDGRGQVVFVEHDMEDEDGLGSLRTRLLAHDFMDFLNRFESRKDYKARRKMEEKEEYARDFKRLNDGALPELLQEVFDGLKGEFPGLESYLRFLCLKVLKQKGFFSLHGEEDSARIYDLVFWAYQQKHSLTEWRKTYENLMWGNMATFGITGYAPGFIEDWWNRHLQEGMLVRHGTEYRFSEEFSALIRRKLEDAAGR